MRYFLALVGLAICSTSASAVEPVADPVAVVSAIPCDTIGDATIVNFGRNGGWFGVPTHQWSDQVFETFNAHAVDCLERRLTGPISSLTGPKELRSRIRAIQTSNRYEIDAAVRKEQSRSADVQRLARENAAAEAAKAAQQSAKQTEAARLLRMAQADNISAAEQTDRIRALSDFATPSAIGEQSARQYQAEIAKLQLRRDRSLTDEAAAWERDRPNREATAAVQAAEIARLERSNAEQAEYQAGERARLAKIAALKEEAAANELRKANEEELKKPLSCETLGRRLQVAGNGIQQQFQEIMATVMMGDQTTTCRGVEAVRTSIKPFHDMAVQCRNVEIGYSLNSILSPLNDLAAESRCR